MRNDLNRRTEVFAFSFFVENVPIYFSGCKVREFIKILVDEAFVMSEVKICFRTVFGDINFSVLIRAHRSGIDVDVRIEFLCGDFESARFKQSPERRGSDPFAESRNDSAGDKNVLCLFHIYSPLRVKRREFRYAPIICFFFGYSASFFAE